MSPHLRSLIDRLVAEGHTRMPLRRPSWISESDWGHLKAVGRNAFRRSRVWLLLSIPAADHGWVQDLTLRMLPRVRTKTAVVMTALRVLAELVGVEITVTPEAWLRKRRDRGLGSGLLAEWPPYRLAVSELEEICSELGGAWRGPGSAIGSVRGGNPVYGKLAELEDHIVGMQGRPYDHNTLVALSEVVSVIRGLRTT